MADLLSIDEPQQRSQQHKAIIEEDTYKIETKILDLPTESLIEVLSFLLLRDLAVVSRLCSFLNVLSKDKYIWRPLCIRWGIVAGDGTEDWKEQFKRFTCEQRRVDEQLAKKVLITQMTARNVKKATYAVVNSRPCEVETKRISRVGRHGQGRVHLQGKDLLTGKLMTEVFPYNVAAEIPVVETTDYWAIEIVPSTDLKSTVFLISIESYAEVTFPLPEGELGEQIRNHFNWADGPEDLRVTVRTVWWAEGCKKEEAIVAVTKEVWD